MSADPLDYLDRSGELTDDEARVETILALVEIASRCRPASEYAEKVEGTVAGLIEAAAERYEQAAPALCGAPTRAGRPCRARGSYADGRCGRHRQRS